MSHVIKSPAITLVFGTITNSIEPESIRNTLAISLKNTTSPSVIFQHQVHGNSGIAITPNNIATYRTLLAHPSDYLITNMTHVGIGVLTADCLPIALLDPKNNAIGIIHAGWRGTVSNIAHNAIKHMQRSYGTNPIDIFAWFGPCAHRCCYTVDDAFINQLPTWARDAVTANKHFDLIACNQTALRECGVLQNNIDIAASQCTICTPQYHSYRRNPSLTSRQPSIIWLN